jgi:hypothetical protein
LRRAWSINLPFELQKRDAYVSRPNSNTTMSSSAALDEIVLNRTWSIHSVTLFSRPLIVNNMQERATKWLRRCRRPRDEGNYVRAKWMTTTASATSDVETTNSFGSNKRKRTIDNENTAAVAVSVKERHLYLEIRIKEVFSASLVFCFADHDHMYDDTMARAHGFSYCLARGSKQSWQTLWEWMESETGCVIGRTPLCPSSVDLAVAVATWTSDAYQQQLGAVGAATSDLISAPTTLSLTFGVPEFARGRGVETVSVQIPSSAVFQMCTNMELHRPGRALPFTGALVVGTTEPAASTEPLPIVRGIHHFIKEQLALDISTFPLQQASCAVASFGLDGRCKPLTTLPLVLERIRVIFGISKKFDKEAVH